MNFLRIQLYGFNFAHVTIEVVDYPQESELDVIIMLDTLESEQASLEFEKYKKLYNQVSQDYNSIKNTYKRNKAIKEDKYLKLFRETEVSNKEFKSIIEKNISKEANFYFYSQKGFLPHHLYPLKKSII